MAEAIRGYPRWEGELSRSPRMFIIAIREVQRVLKSNWAMGALLLAFSYGVVTAGNLYAGRESFGVHTWANFLDFQELLCWAGLALAAVATGPALLEDARKGALELYHSRAATRFDYLAGKSLAIVGLAWAAVSGPALIYWAGTYLVFDEQPEAWAWAWAGILGFGLIWALVVTGLGLGLSSVARSSRAAAIILFGGIALLDILFGRVLTLITRAPEILVMSPLADMAQQATWLFPAATPPYEFEWWWGAAALAGLIALGWGLVYWRHPRLKGVD